MKLMTKELEARFAEVGCQDGKGDDAIVIAKYFFPAGQATWLATEWLPEEGLFFGYASLFNDWNNEWGYFSMAEFEQPIGVFRLTVERDLHWQECTMKEAKEKERIV